MGSIQQLAHNRHSRNAFGTDISTYMVLMKNMKIDLGSHSKNRMVRNWQQNSKITCFSSVKGSKSSETSSSKSERECLAD